MVPFNVFEMAKLRKRSQISSCQWLEMEGESKRMRLEGGKEVGLIMKREHKGSLSIGRSVS